MAREPHYVEFVAVWAFVVQKSVFEVMASYELVYRFNQSRSLQPVFLFDLEFRPILHKDVLYVYIALQPSGTTAVVLFPDFVIKNLLAVLFGLVDIVFEFQEVAVGTQVGVSVGHAIIIKNSDYNSELHAKFISLLFYNYQITLVFKCI